MKIKLLITIFLFASGFIMASCNNGKHYRPEAKIVNAFNSKYPKANKIEWEQEKGYNVAEFYDNGTESKAWFDNNGKWVMTESDIKYNALPQAIRNHFEKSIYNNWRRDDIDKIERAGMKAVYIIEVEKEGQETDLYYNENGTLVKTNQDVKKDDQFSYLPVSATIWDKVKEKYPDATLIETDTEHGKQEIDILQNGKTKEVIFNGNEWVSTSWEVNKSDVPSVVMEALRKSEYAKYRIDDIHFYETPANSYYRFELEQGDKDIDISIDLNGVIIK